MKKTTAKKTPAKTGKELATQRSGPLASKPDVASLAFADAGAGQEDMDRNDFAIPRLAILQALSPQLKKNDAKYIKGAEVGEIVDTVSGKRWSGETGITVIPISYRRANLEWVPRTKGGGLAKDHGSDDSILAKCTRVEKQGLTLPNGNTIQTVGEYFVFLLDEKGDFTPYLLPMASTQLKKSRQWNTLINQLKVPGPNGGTFNPAMFYRSYKLTTAMESKNGNDWAGWVITPGEDVLDMENGEAIYLAARDFRENVKRGAVKAVAPDSHEDPAAAAEGDDSPM